MFLDGGARKVVIKAAIKQGERWRAATILKKSQNVEHAFPCWIQYFLKIYILITRNKSQKLYCLSDINVSLSEPHISTTQSTSDLTEDEIFYLCH